MIPANTHIWLVAGTTDMRRGFASLSGLVQSQLEKSPLSGHVFVFRGRRGDLVKMIWHDGDGTCLLLISVSWSGPPSEVNFGPPWE